MYTPYTQRIMTAVVLSILIVSSSGIIALAQESSGETRLVLEDRGNIALYGEVRDSTSTGAIARIHNTYPLWMNVYMEEQVRDGTGPDPIQFTPTGIGEDIGGIYSRLGLAPPEAAAAWRAEFTGEESAQQTFVLSPWPGEFGDDEMHWRAPAINLLSFISAGLASGAASGVARGASSAASGLDTFHDAEHVADVIDTALSIPGFLEALQALYQQRNIIAFSKELSVLIEEHGPELADVLLDLGWETGKFIADRKLAASTIMGIGLYVNDLFFGTTIYGNVTFSVTPGLSSAPPNDPNLRALEFFRIAGRVYVDGNQSGEFDENDAPVGGVTVRYQNLDVDSETAQQSTEATGTYDFPNVPAEGDYQVSIEVPDGYDVLSPNPLPISSDSEEQFVDFRLLEERSEPTPTPTPAPARPEPESRPVAPSNVQFAPGDGDSLSGVLNWIDQSDNENRFAIYYDVSNSGWSHLQDIPKDSQQFTVDASTLLGDTTFEEAFPDICLGVAAFNDAGTSDIASVCMLGRISHESAFAKTWVRRDFALTISPDGYGTAHWRVYKWCSDDPSPPCDSGPEIITRGGQGKS